MSITPERLRALLDYDPNTGIFTRRVSSGRHGCWPAGEVAGSLCDGYIQICVDRVRYKAHRLAWLWVHGRMPTDQLDHINGDKTDNKLVNLREANNAQNSQNERRPRANNRSGFLGVSLAGNKYRADIKVNRRTIALGRFTTAEAAHAAYLAAKAELHPFSTLNGQIP